MNPALLSAPLTISLLLCIAAPTALAHTSVHDACDGPIPWRIGEVAAHPGTGIDRAAFREEAKRAAALWNQRSGRHVLAYDPENGFPVHLVSGDRQRRADVLRDLHGEIGRLRARVHELETTVDNAGRTFERARARHERKATNLENDIVAHNARVAAYSGDGNDDEARAIQAAIDTLQQRHERLKRIGEELGSRQQRLNRWIETRNEAAERLNAVIQRHNEALAHAPSNAGYYEVDVEFDNRGRPVHTERRITIRFFYERPDLRRTLAHEFGHALGIGHVADPEAVMHASYTAETPDQVRRQVDLRPADLAALRTQCE